ncbi:hypothetical protein HC823_00125 [Candidatus Gracilibacteria bacterium]|nr:hypothetical protein [Candidatus Gracilibacteria bacterium]
MLVTQGSRDLKSGEGEAEKFFQKKELPRVYHKKPISDPLQFAMAREKTPPQKTESRSAIERFSSVFSLMGL